MPIIIAYRCWCGGLREVPMGNRKVFLNGMSSEVDDDLYSIQHDADIVDVLAMPPKAVMCATEAEQASRCASNENTPS